MISKWYVPSWSGDFRLEAEGDDKCRLSVTDPTPAEIDQLGKFLKKARKKGVIPELAGVQPEGKSELLIEAPILDAGKLLLGRKDPRKGLLTAIKSTDGEISVVTGDVDTEEAEKALDKPKADKATTTRRPTLCCPNPVDGREVRASEVLKEFCTRRQWEEWVEKGYLHCVGNLSGHSYRIVHRHHPLAREQTKIVWDVDVDRVIHCYDWSVPPPEEVLAIKLTLENREHWVRNPSGAWTFGLFGGKDIYPDPFMSPGKQGSDGIADAALVTGIGGGLVGGLQGVQLHPILGDILGLDSLLGSN
jgi:hypothetical protein